MGLGCAQRCSGAELDGEVALHLAAPRSGDPLSPPLCIRVLPDSSGRETVTVTATALRVEPGTDSASLMGSALDVLRAMDGRFAALRPTGPVFEGPTNSGFAPEVAVHGGCLLVGDAAGLVNPFTGEGIGFAIHSGLLAACAIADNNAEPGMAARSYVRRLSASFVGYFETARHAARRYHLAWRVLANTAGSDSPFFAKGRRAVLLPEGISGLGAPEHVSLSRRESLLVEPFMLACNEIAVNTVRKEWPFIATLVAAGQSSADQQVRPALLFAAAQMVAGRPPRNEQAVVASAIELAMLGALALIGPGLGGGIAGRGVDWQTATAVLAGDFLLSQAAYLVARYSPDLSAVFADWLAELVALRTESHIGAETARAIDLFRAMFEFPARVGAQLGGASTDEVQTMREFGQHCGKVFLYAEDVLAVRGQRTRLDTTLDGLLSARLSALPQLLDRDDLSGALLRTDEQVRAEALAAVCNACSAAWSDARKALSELPDGIAKRILEEFVRLLATPADDTDNRTSGRR